MKFIIERASGNSEQPCEEAKKEILPYIDSRNFETMAEYKEACKEDFRSEGYGHREVDGHIERVINRECWTIEFNTIEELMEFVDKDTDIIIYKIRGGDPYKTIVIYDDYVE